MTHIDNHVQFLANIPHHSLINAYFAYYCHFFCQLQWNWCTRTANNLCKPKWWGSSTSERKLPQSWALQIAHPTLVLFLIHLTTATTLHAAFRRTRCSACRKLLREAVWHLLTHSPMPIWATLSQNIFSSVHTSNCGLVLAITGAMTMWYTHARTSLGRTSPRPIYCPDLSCSSQSRCHFSRRLPRIRSLVEIRNAAQIVGRNITSRLPHETRVIMSVSMSTQYK